MTNTPLAGSGVTNPVREFEEWLNDHRDSRVASVFHEIVLRFEEAQSRPPIAKDPAVPVNWTQVYALIARMFVQPDEALRSMMAQDLCRLLKLGPNAEDADTRAAHIAAAGKAIAKDREMFTTPAAGAGGEVGARHSESVVKHLMKLVVRVCAEFHDYSGLRNNWTGGEALKARKAYRATLDEIESGMRLLATPATEQAATVSVQGDSAKGGA